MSNSETEAINNNDINFLIQNFDKEYDLLKQYINDQNILENILIMIYFEKYNKISSDEIRNKIFEFVFKKENLFLKSKILINYFLNNCFIPQQDDEDNNNDDEEDKFYFMNFLKEDNEILNIIETNINNNQSEKFILNFFETKLKEYFDTNEIDFNGLSYDYLQKFFDIIQEKNENEFKYKNLTKLYCIAYINNYCYSLIKNFNIQERYKLLDILKTSDDNFYIMIKLLILKIYFILKCNSSYEQFLNQNYNLLNMDFFDGLKKKYENIKYIFKNYFFLIQNEFNIEEYKNNIICFINSYLNNFKLTNNEYYEKLITNKKIIKLFDFLCNQYFYRLKNIDKNIHEKFSNNYKNIFSNLKNETQKNLLNLFFDSKLYNNIENDINNDDYEEFLNCFKLCLIISNNENSFYTKLISNLELINNNYIPGLNKVEDQKGFFVSNFEEFKDNCNSNIRKMNNKTYIILNYLYFSIIYINKILGNISNDEINNYIFENKNIPEIIKEINSILEEKIKNDKYELNIYINLVFEKLYKNEINFEDYDNFNDLENRKKFEEKFNEMIDRIDTEYNSYSEKFKINNEQLKKMNLDIFYFLIVEPNKLNLENNEEFKYFNLLNVPYFITIEDFNSFFDKQNKSKFPIINYYLKYKNDDKFKDLENILKINPFEIYLLEKYSNKITRNEAKENKKIKDELVKKEDEKIFNNFIEGYNNIYEKINYNKGDKIIEAKKLNKEDFLIYFLNDDLEDYGIYLYKIYEHFSKIQNDFLNEIKHPFNYIIPQKAKEEDIVSFKINERYKKYYSSFIEIISLLSNEKKQFSINEIESILYDILIQGKKFFSKKQLKIIYKGEGILDENEDSFRYKFKKLYHQIPIEDNLQKAIKNYFNEKSLIEFEEIIQALDQIINILINEKYNINDNIKEKIMNIEKYKNKLNKSIYNMFEDNEISKIKIENLISVYEYIEEIKFPEINEKIDNFYKEDNECKINDEISKNLKNYIEENEKKIDSIIKKKDIIKATKLFIIRNLFKNENNKKNKKLPLFKSLMKKDDIWDIKIFENKNKFENELEYFNNNFELTLINILEFYYLLEPHLRKKEETNKNKKKKRGGMGKN